MEIWGYIQLLRQSEMIWCMQLTFSSSSRRAYISYSPNILYVSTAVSVWGD